MESFRVYLMPCLEGCFGQKDENGTKVGKMQRVLFGSFDYMRAELEVVHQGK